MRTVAANDSRIPSDLRVDIEPIRERYKPTKSAAKSAGDARPKGASRSPNKAAKAVLAEAPPPPPPDSDGAGAFLLQLVGARTDHTESPVADDGAALLRQIQGVPLAPPEVPKPVESAARGKAWSPQLRPAAAPHLRPTPGSPASPPTKIDGVANGKALLGLLQGSPGKGVEDGAAAGASLLGMLQGAKAPPAQNSAWGNAWDSSKGKKGGGKAGGDKGGKGNGYGKGGGKDEWW